MTVLHVHYSHLRMIYTVIILVIIFFVYFFSACEQMINSFQCFISLNSL